MNVYLISDTHFKHEKMRTYCDRPSDFTDVLICNWKNTVKPEDTVIHLGDVAIGPVEDWEWIIPSLPGKKVLILGNHDDQRSVTWWMRHGFDFACEGLKFRNCWLTHRPDTSRAGGCDLNIHGHLHNIWHGFKPDGGLPETKLHQPWQRLFAVEYTGYMPIEFDKFVSHPKKYLAKGLGD